MNKRKHSAVIWLHVLIKYSITALTSVLHWSNSKCTLAPVTSLLLMFVAVSSNAALVSRLDGQAYFDDELEITWIADANINGRGTWDYQMAWAASLEIDGITDWRLASMDVNGDGTILDCLVDGPVDCKDNELSYMFYYNHITPGSLGQFSNPGNPRYWSNVETELGGSTNHAYYFNFLGGGAGNPISGKGVPNYAWAVHDGDVAANVVPIPAAAYLFASGLGLLGWIRRRKTV
jgi:hypothetical protein